jgi:hypothetical protein
MHCCLAIREAPRPNCKFVCAGNVSSGCAVRGAERTEPAATRCKGSADASRADEGFSPRRQPSLVSISLPPINPPSAMRGEEKARGD